MSFHRKVPENPTLRGERYRRTHADSVKAILGHLAPPVQSRGSKFYNRDRWTLRVFIESMCSWAHGNPGRAPTRKEIRAWVEMANHFKVHCPQIVIANTPDHLPYNLFMALVGGAYHEALHSHLSCRRPLTVDEMAAIVIPRWEGVKNWSHYHWLVQDWANIVEDIRIEREGSRLFPGVKARLEALQDLILRMEGQGEHDVRSHGEHEEHEDSLLDLLAAVFRDLGLGYQTEIQLKALASYREKSKDTFDFVLRGPLAKPLRDAISLGDDDTGCIRVALDAVISIVDASVDPEEDTESEGESGDPAPPEGDGEGEEGEEEEGEGEEDGEEEEEEGEEGEGEGEGEEGEGSYFQIAVSFDEDAQEQTGLGLLDNNMALEMAFREEGAEETVGDGERPWSPYDPSEDVVQNIPPSKSGIGADTKQVDGWLREVSQECSFLRARMSTIIRALEMTDIHHGSRFGSKISERRLVDSFIDISAGIPADRPFVITSEKFDKSMVVALVLDESQSMEQHKTDSTKMMLVLADTFHRLGIPFQCSGIRVGGTLSYISGTEARIIEEDVSGSMYHRYHNVIHDVFKRFEEDFRRIRWRFANPHTIGGTPLADGIQFGLDALNYRDEAHRVLIVVTDGKPNIGANVIPWQLSLARDAGVHVIGVGVGEGAQFVQKVFEHGIWDAEFSAVPKLILSKLNELVDLMSVKRGRRMRSNIK